ncbi:hypothetical protein [Streptomyces niveus]
MAVMAECSLREGDDSGEGAEALVVSGLGGEPAVDSDLKGAGVPQSDGE